MILIWSGVFITLCAIFLRSVISLNEYSGYGKAPMYGDYEAQRHWMEITVNLPITQWYFNGTDNDILYWGLDYPPLTAYHSWICGQIAKCINPAWVELKESRGYESYHHKLFMRYTALVSDVLIYISASVTFCFFTKIAKSSEKILTICTLLFYPGLILIDHGHFQYNHVCLGLTLFAIAAIHSNHDNIASVLFVLALNYKQMSLYYAMPFFCYLLGKCFGGKELWLLKLSKLGFCVIITFIVCWLPFVFEISLAKQVLHRIFPLARGLFEDKVANIWCSISVIIKLKQLISVESQALLCTTTTAVALLPSSVNLLVNPSLAKFRFALINSSLIFFLFSFQVHEKSILLPALPVCLIIQQYPILALWFLQISTISMWPLFVKDGLCSSTIASILLFHIVAHIIKDVFVSRQICHSSTPNLHKIQWILYCISVYGASVIVVIASILQPPSGLPDFYPLIISIYSCINFVVFLVLCHWLQIIN